MVRLINSAERLIETVKTTAKAYRNGGKVLIPYGDAGFYRDSSFPILFISRTEAVMKVVNSGSAEHGVRVRWGTLREYFEAVEEDGGEEIGVFEGEFGPLMTKYVTEEYWIGGYSLLPGLKRKISEGQELARLAEILSTAVLGKEVSIPSLTLPLHSDVLSGLGNSSLSHDYSTILAHGTGKALDFISQALNAMLPNTSKPVFPVPFRPIFLYNSLNWRRNTLFHFESPRINLEIVNSDGKSVTSQAIFDPVSLNYTVYFNADLSALSVNVWAIVEHDNACEKCTKLSKASKSLSLSGHFALFSVKFGSDGKVVSISHPDFGEKPFLQDFLSFQNARTDPFLFLPSVISYDHAVKSFPLYLSSFTIVTGELLSAAQSVWTHGRKTISQLVVIPHMSDRMYWDFKADAMENEDLMVGFRSNFTENNGVIRSFDGLAWRDTKESKIRSQFEIGRNFVAISGAFATHPGPIFIPKQPLGVGIYDNAYLFHLQRSEKHGDVGVSEHSFTLAGMPTMRKWKMEYYEGKMGNLLGSFGREGKVEIGTVMDKQQWDQPWQRETCSSLSFESVDFYLSTLIQQDQSPLLRIQPFTSTLDLTWNNATLEEETDITGYFSVSLEASRTNKGKEICYLDCQQRKVVQFADSEQNLPIYRSFRVKFAGKVYTNPSEIEPIEGGIEMIEKSREKRAKSNPFLVEGEAYLPTSPPSSPEVPYFPIETPPLPSDIPIIPIPPQVNEADTPPPPPPPPTPPIPFIPPSPSTPPTPPPPATPVTTSFPVLTDPPTPTQPSFLAQSVPLEVVTSDFTLVEYGLFASLSLMAILAITCFFRTSKRRKD